jgi:hypothetical protein
MEFLWKFKMVSMPSAVAQHAKLSKIWSMTVPRVSQYAIDVDGFPTVGKVQQPALQVPVPPDLVRIELLHCAAMPRRSSYRTSS